MQSTGRITKLLTPGARRILFEGSMDQQIDADLPDACNVDRAHLIMLAECGIVDRKCAGRLLCAIQKLIDQRFQPLRNCPAPRGLYLMYEEYLISSLGADVAGMLQIARSRNDLNATVFKLKIRAPYIALLDGCIRLTAVLLRRSRKYRKLVMPAYTHSQAAVPITYGHYLLAVAAALSRDLLGFMALATDLQTAPLGAGAAGGTTLAIQPERAAALLGFDQTSANSLDAVASRDLALRFLAVASILCVTLSRLATDLLQWTTTEFGFLELPEELSGSSSAMPQKMNPFLLEHIQGGAAAAVGAFATGAMAMHASHFTNSIAVGTEGAHALWNALRKARDLTALARLMVAGSKPNAAAMERRARESFTTAMALANRLVTTCGLDFRTAHRLTGEVIRAEIAAGNTSLTGIAERFFDERSIPISLSGLDPQSVCFASEFGGGPGLASMERCEAELRERCRSARAWRTSQTDRWRRAQANLEGAAALLAGTS